MQVVITQPFFEHPSPVFQAGEVLDVPEATAIRWIAQNHAQPKNGEIVDLSKAEPAPTAPDAKPASQKRDTAVRKVTETRQTQEAQQAQ